MRLVYVFCFFFWRSSYARLSQLGDSGLGRLLLGVLAMLPGAQLFGWVPELARRQGTMEVEEALEATGEGQAEKE